VPVQYGYTLVKTPSIIHKIFGAPPGEAPRQGAGVDRFRGGYNWGGAGGGNTLGGE